ncbi:MAG: hypothetical protein HBSAPP03_03610 [Phycisphaerae bacterium]|nr:MAG: hypothetical protein HBSAPP03_03610 [Phycisphaerae bacterium]
MIFAGFFVGACGPTIVPDFNSPEPAARNAAIVQAVDNRDASKIPDLVRMLDSDDPATRLLAIQALERLTGQRYGYDPAASATEREPAIAKWVAYVNQGRPEDPNRP